MFDALPTPCLILDRRFNIVGANDAYLLQTLTRLPEILGRPIFDLFPAPPVAAGAADGASLRASLERALVSRQPDPMPMQRYTLRRPPEQGGGFEERYWSPLNVPMLDEWGEVAYLLHRVENVTEIVLQLRNSEQTLRLAQQIGRIGTFKWDIVRNEVHWSPEIAALYGLPVEPFKDALSKWCDLIHPDERPAIEALVGEALQSGIFEAEWRVIWPDGSVHWIAGRAEVHRDDAGRPHTMLGVNIDITDRKTAEEMTRQVALHDPLTGLPNRALLGEFAEHLLATLRRRRRKAALLFIDLDRFKPINDTYGHDAGDAVLKDFAKRLTHRLRGEDLVGRIGGDEFVTILAHVHGEHDVGAIASHLLDDLGRPYLACGVEVALATSIGISLFPRDGNDVDTLIRRADMAMYEAKRLQCNAYRFFRPELDLDRPPPPPPAN
ncbi:MAG TPA: diguanylate cyclase [Aromatoleum sp.]|uniref:diguanylate cyclase domain-containing protein n=1 Tax=Aromatoleum sp. TaxID=2307007 RepID=UPI002B49C9C0|nr:diguanylate cyclase [Aromatoleum sp.]HJV25591.1 diguanylate cyclase [Aromatoleum sp.]